MNEQQSAADPVQTANEVRAELTGPGGRWETTTELVLGESVPVFTNRRPHVPAILRSQCERWADRDCLVIDDTRITYAELADRVAATAHRLRDEFGVEKGDRVAILAANCPEWVIAFHATAALGAITAAFNGWWTTPELDHAAALTTPVLLIGDQRRLERVGELPDGTKVLDLDARPEFFADGEAGQALPEVEIAEDDPTLILFTSGTTGRAKGATVSHRGLVGFIDVLAHNTEEKKTAALRFMGIDPASLPEPGIPVQLNTSPLFHVSGLSAGILNNMEAGATIVFRRGRFDAGDVLRLIEKHGVTAWNAPGDTAPRVMRHPDFATTDTSSIAQIGSGGAHLSPALRAEIETHFPNAAMALGQGYGSSESVAVVATTGGPEFQANPGTTGSPHLHIEVEIRDDSGAAVLDGVDGEIHVRSAYNMLGYWGDEAATAATLKDGRWLAMGDVGRIENGMLFLNSRAREMIIRSGENISPVEVEHWLESHPDVAEAAVFGVDHIDRGQDVKAIVVPVAGRDLDDASLAEHCRGGLAPYKVPTEWEIRTEALPRNATGKVIKGVLRGDQDLTQIES